MGHVDAHQRAQPLPSVPRRRPAHVEARRGEHREHLLGGRRPREHAVHASGLPVLCGREGGDGAVHQRDRARAASTRHHGQRAAARCGEDRDVDDSILPKARELGIPYLELADAEMARFHSDMAALEMRPPIAEPRATEAIDQIIELVAKLLESGHAYLTHGTAYFDVSTFPAYGQLSPYPEHQMVRLARERGGNPDDPHRRAPL